MRSSYDHDGAWCVEHDLLADRAEQQTFEAAVHEVTRVALERFWIHHHPGTHVVSQVFIVRT